MGADKAARKVFNTRLILDNPDFAHTVNTQWVEIPEWGGRGVYVWGTKQEDTARIASDIRLAGDDIDKAEMRRLAATVRQCCRDGDGPDAKRVFGISDQEWLEKQPNSVLWRIVNVVQELDANGGLKEEDIISFFVMTEALQSCLTAIASACGASIDSLQNCPDLPAPRRFVWLCSRIESLLSEKTDTFATTA